MPARRQSLKLRNAFKSGKVFDPRSFLATAGIGRTLRHYSAKEVIFTEGERADTILYIQQGRVRLSVLSKQGKEATIALLGRAISWVKDASPRINSCERQRQRRLLIAPF